LHDISKIRNFGIIAHIDAGKTTTTEKLLLLTGVIKHSGRVDEGTAYTDWLYEEKKHGITIKSAAIKCKWHTNEFNIIDTPGHIDFSSEVHRSLRVLDSTVTIICGISGIQAQTQHVTAKAKEYELPGLIFINKLDREGASFESVLKQIEERFNYRTLPIIIPYYTRGKFNGIIDIIELHYFTPTSNTPQNIPEDYTDVVEIYRDLLFDTLSLHDDKLLEKLLHKKSTLEDIKESIRKQTINKLITPVLCGSSINNIGIYHLAESIKNYLPSPDESLKRNGFNTTNSNNLKLLYIFKTISSASHSKPLFYARIYKGKITKNDVIWNPDNSIEYKILQIFEPDIQNHTEIESAETGDIVIILLDLPAKSGDTLSDKSNHALLEKIHFPEPVLYVKIETNTYEDKLKFNQIKDAYLLDDPTLRYKEDPLTGETLIGGIGELQIEIFIEMIKNNHKLYVKQGKPQIAYRVCPIEKTIKTIRSQILFEGEAKTININLTIEEILSPKNSNEIQLPDTQKKDILINEIHKCLLSSDCGPYPFINTRVTIDSISNDNINETVLYAGITKIILSELKNITTKKLEPIMNVIIETEREYTGAVTGDIQSRKGSIIDIMSKNQHSIIYSKIPMKNLFGYSTHIRDITAGTSDFSIIFSEYT